MRKVSYGGAMSLDGFIAGPHGEHDWILMDPDIDFAEMMARFDTFLIGRKTFEAMRGMGGDADASSGIQNIVFSRTLKPSDYPNVTISDNAERTVADLPTASGRSNYLDPAKAAAVREDRHDRVVVRRQEVTRCRWAFCLVARCDHWS